MAFTQEKIDRVTNQSRGIFNRYVYRTDDTIAQVLVPGYFSACRFAIEDGPLSNSKGWDDGIVECHCSDGYIQGSMVAATGTLDGQFTDPSSISQADFINSSSPTSQIPVALGTPLQVSFGALVTTPQIDLSAAGAFTCKIAGQYRFVFSAQAGRVGGAGVVNLFLRLLKNGAQIGNTSLARLDNAATIVPLRFIVTFTLAAGDVLVAQIVQDSSGIAGSGGLYAVTPATAGWGASPSAAVAVSQITSGV